MNLGDIVKEKESNKQGVIICLKSSFGGVGKVVLEHYGIEWNGEANSDICWLTPASLELVKAYEGYYDPHRAKYDQEC